MEDNKKLEISIVSGEQFNYDYILQNRVLKLYQDDKRVTIAKDKTVPMERENELMVLFRELDLEFITISQKEFNDLVRDIADTSGLKESATEQQQSREDLSKLASDAPIVNLVNSIIIEAIDKQASDIHFEAYDDYFRVRLRINGFLQEQGTYPKKMFEAVSARIKFLSKLDITQRFLAQDGKALLTIGELKLDIRTSTMPSVWGESIVLRLLGVDQQLDSLSSLGFDSETIEELKTITSRTTGAFILTGPTGSGKTTTLRSLLRMIDIATLKVLTIEDPVEYTIDSITQMQVNERIGFGFNTALRNMLRQDPNVIMIGEMRDKETADLALRSAMTGHLVLSTLHTNDSVASITRLINMGIEPYVIESSVVAAAAQRLVRVLCESCKTKTSIAAADKALFQRYGIKPGTIYRPVGCGECAQTGFSGRTGVFELFQIDDRIRDMIISRAPLGTIREYLKEQGFIPMFETGLKGVSEGRFDLTEIKSIIGEIR
jgi:type II secretory ATPase GspE/PulE/Tfp pilus assembly ATPase PilB-like protein